MPNFLRSLRPLGPRKWQVIIDTHTAASEEPDPVCGYCPKVTGRRPLGEPVAIITRDTQGTYHAYIEKWKRSDADGSNPVYDTVEIGTDSDLKTLARRIGDGEFDYDFRFEIFTNPEPDSPSDLYYVHRYAVPSQQELDAYSTDDPYGDVEAAREVQNIPMEERWAMYAERGW